MELQEDDDGPQGFSGVVRRVIKGITKAFIRYRIEQKLEAIKEYLSDHPIIAVIVLIFAAFSAIPVIIYLTFAAGSLVFTLVGFLVLEGIILTAATIFLGFVLCVVGFFSLFASGFIVLILVCVSLTNNFVGYFTRNKTNNSEHMSSRSDNRPVAKEE